MTSFEAKTGFGDIEMLEIDGISSDADSMNDSSIPSTFGSDESTEPVVLKDWLTTDKTLDFQFNEEEYKGSVDSDDPFSLSYVQYVNSIYKVIEGLNNVDLRYIEQESEIIEEPLGVISGNHRSNKSTIIKDRKLKITRAFLTICESFDQFVNNLQSIEDEESIDKYEYLSSILDCIKAHYFSDDVNQIPESLTKWINRFDPQPDQELLTDVMMDPSPYTHPFFWNKLITKLITRGLFEQAVNCIEESKFRDLKQDNTKLLEIIQDFQSLLASYISMALKGQFPQWKLSCCEFRDSFSRFKKDITEPNQVIMLDQIHELVNIMTGLPKTIAYFSDSWYELYTSLSLFQVRDDRQLYTKFYEVSMEEKPPLYINDTDDIMKSTERCFIDILEGNLLHMLTKIDEIDSATAAFIARLFELNGSLQEYYSIDRNQKFVQNSKTISQYLLIKFSFDCLSHHNLVPVAIGLLRNTDINKNQKSINHNRTIIENFLPKYHCKTNDDLEWCLTICAELGLVDTANSLFRIHGNKSLNEGHVYEALNMLANCYSYEINDEKNRKGMKEMHNIVWNILFQDCLINNRPIPDILINNIVNHEVDKDFKIHPIVRQCLSPYAVLVEFYKTASKEAYEHTPARDKVSRLFHLLEFNHLPKKFSVLILAQFIPFMINTKFVFQIPDLIVIIELIDNFESTVNDEEYEKAKELYKLSIDNIDSDAKPYDWRIITKNNDCNIPETIEDLLRYLRNEITSKIGQVYINDS